MPQTESPHSWPSIFRNIKSLAIFSSSFFFFPWRTQWYYSLYIYIYIHAFTHIHTHTKVWVNPSWMVHDSNKWRETTFLLARKNCSVLHECFSSKIHQFSSCSIILYLWLERKSQPKKTTLLEPSNRLLIEGVKLLSLEIFQDNFSQHLPVIWFHLAL